MNRVNYISHMLEDNVEDVKSLALYYDKISIIEQRHLHLVAPVDAKPDKYGRMKVEPITTRDFTDMRFPTHLADFEKSGLIDYKIDIDSGGTSTQPGYIPVISDMQINDLVLSRLDLMGGKLNEKHGVDKNGHRVISWDINLNKEAEHLVKQLFPQKKDSIKSLTFYYARVFKTFVNYYEKGNNVLTTSKYINDLFGILLTTDRFKEVSSAFKNELKVEPSFALEAIKVGVPNLAKFPPEEILKFKESSKSELMEFTARLEELTLDLLANYDTEYIVHNAQRIADIKLTPIIKDISDSLEISKFKILQELVKEAKDPKSYSPLLLTFSKEVSNTLALLVSIGLISLSAGMEHYSRVKEAKRDGVYYLYKARKYFE